MKKIEVPGVEGGWLEVREPEELTVKGRRRLQAAFASAENPMKRVQAATQLELTKMTPEGVDEHGVRNLEHTMEQKRAALEKAQPVPELTEDEADRLMMLQQAMMVATIGRWHRPEEITRLTLDEMRANDYDPISAASDPYCQAVLERMQVEFEPTPQTGDLDDPTGASPV